jgi:hypothetical protein
MANLYMKNRVSSPPTMTWYMLIRSPEIIIAIARASRSGQNELGGMWIAAISAAVTGACLAGGAPPCPSPYFCRHSSSRSCTWGTRAKL